MELDDFLEHHGVKGMKWGKHKANSTPSPKQAEKARLKGLDKETRKTKHQLTRNNLKLGDTDKGILRARAMVAGGKTDATLAKAHAEYATQKKQIGKVAAKRILTQHKENVADIISSASHKTHQEITQEHYDKVAQILVNGIFGERKDV